MRRSTKQNRRERRAQKLSELSPGMTCPRISHVRRIMNSRPRAKCPLCVRFGVEADRWPTRHSVGRPRCYGMCGDF